MLHEDHRQLQQQFRLHEEADEEYTCPRAAYFKQAQYGVYVRMALILRLLEVEV